ncbi:MAG TPA: hypothetical protein VFV51_19470, partial [Vicinamibacterales bacterium]|nr:hypothetical protein [Vicinamibacterales bacterium]
MADRSPENGRVCPQCERRVPRTVAKCRCGAVLPADDLPSAEPSAGGSSILTYVLILAVVGAAGYWALMREPAAPPQ